MKKNVPCLEKHCWKTCFAVTIFSLFATLTSHAQFTWDGGGADNNWFTAGNWNPDAAPAASFSTSLIFGGTTGLTNVNNITGGILTGLTFNAGAGAFVLSGNALTSGAGSVVSYINNSSNTQTISLPLLLANNLTASGGASIVINGGISHTSTLSRTITNNLTSGTLTLGGSLGISSGSTTGRTWTFTGAATTSTLVTGILANGGTAAAGITIQPDDMRHRVVLSGANIYTGGTTVNSGILRLDFASAGATDINIINNTANSSALTLSGGVLEIQGASGETNSQRFSGLTLGANRASAIRILQNGAAAVNVTLGSISRSSGATLDLTLPTSGTITSTTMTSVGNGDIMADSSNRAYATVDGFTWATNTSGTLGALAASGYQFDFVSATGNTDVRTALTPGAVVTANTLRFNHQGMNLSLSSTGASTITTGGILVTRYGGGSSISAAGAGAALQSSATADQLIIHNYSSGFTLSAPLKNNGVDGTLLVISGTGTTMLNGSNTHSSGTVLTGGGNLVINSAAALGSGTLTLAGGGIGISGPGSAVSFQASTDLVGFSGGITNAVVVTGGSPIISGSSSIEFRGSVTNSGGDRIIVNNIAAGKTLEVSGSVFLSESAGTGRVLTIAGSGSTILSGVVSNFNGTGTAGGLTYNGNGRLTLTNANTYTGSTTVNSGSLRITNVAALGDTIGTTTINAGSLELAFATDSTVAENFVFSGSGNGGSGAIRNISGNNTLSGALNIFTGGGSIGADTGTTLTLSGTIRTNSTTANRTVTFIGGGNIQISGQIVNNIATTSINKNGAGTLTLLRDNSYTGSTSVNAGVLLLDFNQAAAPASNMIAASSALNLGGGTLRPQGKSGSVTTQTFGALTVNSGLSTYDPVLNGATSVTTTTGAFSRSFGGAVRFILPTSTAFRVTGNADNTILNTSGVAFATVGTTDWAATGTDLGGGVRGVVGLSTISGGYTASTSSTLAGNADVAAGVTATAIAADTSITSLRFAQAQATTITNSSGVTLSTGGILVSSDVGSFTSTIIGGTLRTSGTANPDLVIFQNNTLGDLVINSNIAEAAAGTSSIIKAGAGRLILGGAVSPTGIMRIHEGTVQWISAGTWEDSLNIELGSGTSSGVFVLGSGAIGRSITTTQVVGRGFGTGNAIQGGASAISTLTIVDTSTSDLTNVMLGDGTAAVSTANNLALSAAGGGVVQLGAANTYSGLTNISRTTFEVTVLANAGTASSVGTGLSNSVIEMGSNATTFDMISVLRYLGTNDSVTDRQLRLRTESSSATPSILAVVENNGTGALRFTQAVAVTGSTTLARTFRLSGTNTGANEIVSITDGPTSVVSLEKTGTGTWALTGNSSNTGITTISGGMLRLGNGGTAGMLGGGDIAIASEATLATNRSDTFTLGQAITGAGAVRIENTGPGTAILSSSANTYSGGTVLASGGLRVTNTNTASSATGTGELFTMSGTSLGGTGTISPTGSNSVIIGGSVTPGVAGTNNGIGTLRFTPVNGNVILQGGSSVAFELLGNGSHDKITFAASGSGLLDFSALAAGSLSVSFVGGYTPVSGHSFDLLDWSAVSGAGIAGLSDALLNFTNAVLGAGLVWDTSQFATAGVITIVPEPSRGFFAVFGGVCLVMRRRR